MPTAPLRPCSAPGCNVLGPCATHDAARGRIARASLPPWAAWYHIARWRHPTWGLRARALRASPVCVACRATGRIVAATEVDHITPHRGDPSLFWNFQNLQALCWSCHQQKTNRGE
jgi:5-methylcytosine-specific restriction enzyme A